MLILCWLTCCGARQPRSDDGKYHYLRRKPATAGGVAVEQKSLIIADYRSVDPHDVKHPAAVDRHCRAVRTANAVLRVRNLVDNSETRPTVVGSRQVDLLVLD